MNNRVFRTVRGYEILEKQRKSLSHSMEDYLEMIYRISLIEEYVRITTLADSLNVQAPSVTKMVQKLANRGYLNYEKYGVVQLTEEGEEKGKFLLKRHEIIEEFLKNIGVEEKLLENVELIEHSVTKGALDKIEILNQFFVEKPDILARLKEFRIFYDEGE